MITQRLTRRQAIEELRHAIAWMHKRFADLDFTPRILADAESELAELVAEERAARKFNSVFDRNNYGI